ncbi:DUF5131 family protein [Mesorhizobium sp.]|uniref:DUF5131 family protein n=1 Tax=Mesorhizobium sp. TaxID=1871066 RepID=UPI000FE342CA|nr:phage Gp37/Gp68 family protein [Mesorhizobium sp.]RWQ12383.1 MAG: phage Gp37/Gp68 family protein [Mesorhizobium sp.]
MADKSAIEWTDATWTPIRARNRATGKVGWHCEHDTTGCQFCYSEGFNKRLGTGLPFKPGHRKDIDIFLDEEMLTAPLRWKKPRMIFVCSMTDLFADFVPDEWIDKVFAIMALAPQHTFQVLTKRAKRMREYLTQHRTVQQADVRNRLAWETTIDVMSLWFPDWKREGIDGPHRSRAIAAFTAWPLPNVWLGVSAERQQEADERIPELLATPAAVRFVSAEPLLGPIDFGKIIRAATFAGRLYPDGKTGPIGWIIVGGESGPSARPMHPAWARSIRDQCRAAGVHFFFKQWGGWQIASQENGHFDNDMSTNDASWVAVDGRLHKPSSHGLIDPIAMWRVGKKAAGRLLDGIEHNAMPEAR